VPTRSRAEGRVKVLAKISDRSPKEPKRRRGHGWHARLIASLSIADHEPGIDLEVDVRSAGAEAIRQELRTNGAEGRGGDESLTPGAWEETPEAKPWTWERDETSSQGARRSKPSRGCETLRADRR
jgi:hypothetical protein